MAPVLIGYFLLFLFCVNKIVECLYKESEQYVVDLNTKKEGLLKKKHHLIEQKRIVENESKEIFTLFEITKDITKSFNEKDAFEIFKVKLAEHVKFDKCELLDPLVENIKELRKVKEYFVFTLQGKKRKIGYISVLGLPELDKEKFMIMAHQFALALRRVKLHQEVEQTAITDGLTEMYTRGYTFSRFEEEFSRAKSKKISLSFLMVDVDHFKILNDQYGHLTGDKILRKIAKIIKENIREIDIGGRYGGEEFCVILPDTDNKGARYAAERIRKAAEETQIRAYDAVVNITVSIGVATYPKNGSSVTEIVDKADWALYRAKKRGRNKICVFGVYDE